MKKLIIVPGLWGVAASPAVAETEAFFSLKSTEFVVLVAFILFLAALLYLKVPGLLLGLLDKRATRIRGELDEARGLREEAKAILADYERKQKEALALTARIVGTAREEAQAAASQARDDLKLAIARRLAAADERIASTRAAAVRDVRERAVTFAIAAAGDVLARQMTAEAAAASIDAAIGQVEAKLH